MIRRSRRRSLIRYGGLCRRCHPRRMMPAQRSGRIMWYAFRYPFGSGRGRPVAAFGPAGSCPSARGPGGGADRCGKRPARWNGVRGPGRSQSRAGALRQLHRAYRRRSQLRYPDDGDHDDVRCRAGRGLGPAGCPVGAAASGGPAADGDGRCRPGRRRDRPPWPLHQVRFPLGDDRVPDRYRGQYRVQPGRQSHRGSRAWRLPAGQSPQRPRPSGRHRPGGAADRVVRARHPGGAVVHPARGGESAHRLGDPHARGGPRGRGQGGQGRRPGRPPARASRCRPCPT